MLATFFFLAYTPLTQFFKPNIPSFQSIVSEANLSSNPSSPDRRDICNPIFEQGVIRGPPLKTTGGFGFPGKTAPDIQRLYPKLFRGFPGRGILRYKFSFAGELENGGVFSIYPSFKWPNRWCFFFFISRLLHVLLVSKQGIFVGPVFLTAAEAYPVNGTIKFPGGL